MKPEDHTPGRIEPRHRLLARTLALLAILMPALFFSCDESLPPPEDPFAVLQVDLQMLALNNMINVRDGVPLGGSGVISLAVTNIHDEVLDDSAAIEVDLDVWLKDDPSVRAHLRIDKTYLTTGGVLVGGVLTMRPRVPITVYYPWSHRAADDTPFWDHVHLTAGLTQGGVPYCQSDTLTFSAEGSARLFPRIAPVPIPVQDFRLLYRVYYGSCPQDLTKI